MPKFYYVKSSNCPKSLLLSLAFLFCPLYFFGQSLTGLWTGALNNDSTTVRKDQLFEIALTEYNGKVYGYSRSEFVVNDTLYYIVKRVKGTIEGDICEVTDDEIVSYNFRGRLDKGIKVTSTFRRNQTDSTWHLDGTWKTNATKKYYSVTGKVALSEEKDLAVSKLFPHLEELNLANEIAFYKERIPGPAVVRVARPTTTTIIRQPVNSGSVEALTVSARPVNTVQAEIKQPEETPVAPVQKTDAAFAKTETRNISASNDKPVVQQPDITTVHVEPKQPEEILMTPVQKTGDAVVKTETNKIPVNSQVPVVQQPNINTTSPNKSIAAGRVNTQEPPVATNNTGAEMVKRTAASGNVQPGSNKTTAGKPLTDVSPAVAKNKPASSPAGNNSTSNGSVKPAAARTIVTEIPAENKPVVAATKPATPPASVNNTLAKTQPAAATPATAAGVARPAETARVNMPDITTKAAFIAGRKSEFSQVVNFSSDSLVISLYDNGEIDGDTVSVFMNGEPLLSRQGLKSSAIRKTIYITPGQQEDFTLVMFAESLGKYPPNTGLLVIRDGDDVYNLRFSSDFEKNAGIVFRRKK